MSDLLYMEVDLRKFASNLQEVLASSGKSLIPVIKSNAYGCGALEISRVIQNSGIDLVAVVDIDEAKEIAQFSFEILILNSIKEEDINALNQFLNIVISINSLADAKLIYKSVLKRNLKVHIQIDTGMSRLGFNDISKYLEALQILKEKDEVILEGIYTHFTDVDNYLNQIEEFKPYLNYHPYQIIHLSGSATCFLTNFGTHIRVGINLYAEENNSFQQIIKIACKPLAINKIKKGSTVGYDRFYQAKEDQLIAVLPIGYYNGYRRELSGFFVLANNKKFYTIGKVCMNHLFVLIDDSISLDTEFIITSKDLPISLLADYLKTVPHEILCMFRINEIRYLK